MHFLNIRKIGFWGIDFVKGCSICKHLNNIYRINDMTNEYDKWLCRKLDTLIKHSIKETQYYRNIRMDAKIDDFPIINKNDIKRYQKYFLAKNLENTKLHLMSTSGSTGTPYTIMQDVNKRRRVEAEVIYYGEMCGYKLGEKYLNIKAWSKKIMESKYYHWKRNCIPIDATSLDEEALEYVGKWLHKTNKIKCLIAYGSYLGILSLYLLNKGNTPKDFSISTIISGGDELTVETKQRLKDVFGATIVSRYSNQENGIIAQEGIIQNGFCINRASYHLEFLKIDSDEEASPGEPARIILTDLYNYATPIIRYDTGDIGIYSITVNNQKIIKSIEGRMLDQIYDTKGRMISSIVIGAKLREAWPDYNKIGQYQLIQESKRGYKLILNYSIKDDNCLLVQTLKNLLGVDAQISIKNVNYIPITSSGKFKYVKNNLYSNR